MKNLKTKGILKEIEKKAASDDLPIIGPKKGQVLVSVIKKYQPLRILEVGTNVGYSTILMASSFPETVRQKAKIITIEIDPQTAASARRNIKKANLEKFIEVKVGDAKEVIPKLKGRFNMLFLDAIKEEYLDYLKLAEPLLSQDAVIVADNVGIFKMVMHNFLAYVRESGRYKSKTYDFVTDAVEVSIRG